MSNGIGIDFGATAWRAAVFEDGRCRLAPETVSVPGERGVAVIDPHRTMLRDPDNPHGGSVSRSLRLETVKANLGTGRRLRDVKGHIADTFETQALAQLRALRANLEEHLGAEIVGAAVGVPACYGMNQRAALRSVAETAGWGNVALIDESVAAAMSSYQNQTEPRHVLVYCLGQSVFAASVLSVGGGQPQALDHEGSTQLGGQDFEAMLVQQVVRELLRSEKVDIRYNRSAIRELIERAEQVKIALSAASEVPLEVEYSEGLIGQAFHLELQVSRAVLEKLIAPLVAQTIALSRKAIQAASLRLEDIAEVLLVGKPTYTPLVVEEVRRAFGRQPRRADADAVACGAALYAASMHSCFVPRTGSRPAAEPMPLPREREEGPVAAMHGPDREKPVAPGLPVGEPEDALLTAVRRARQQLQTHDLEAGIEAFEDVLDQVREEISYLYSKRASELRQEGRLDEAQATLERGLRYWPENTHIRQLLADIHASKARELARRGFYAQSKGHLRKSLELDPANLSARELAQELERVLGGRGKRPQGRRPGR